MAARPSVNLRSHRLKTRFLGDVRDLQSVVAEPKARRCTKGVFALFEKFTESALRSVIASQKEAQLLQAPEVASRSALRSGRVWP